MTIIIGTTRGITTGIGLMVGMAVLIGTQGGGMTHGTAPGIMVGIGRGDGIILITTCLITVRTVV